MERAANSSEFCRGVGTQLSIHPPPRRLYDNARICPRVCFTLTLLEYGHYTSSLERWDVVVVGQHGCKEDAHCSQTS
eukprot:5507731-Pyramimonas_sp.AAC.1